jgi:hypothetical protein
MVDPAHTGDINITRTNRKRREINNKVINGRDDVEPAPLSERVYLGYKKRADARYGVEVFDAAKLQHIVANKKHYAALLSDSQSRSPEDCLIVAEKYLANSQNGTKQVEYTKPRGRGRWQPEKSQSLGTLTRQIRHTIAGELYDDLDIDNCHPSLLVQMCGRMGLDTPILDFVVGKRDEMFKMLITDKYDRGYVKKMVLAVINGGMRDMKQYVEGAPGKQVQWLREFKKEVDKIHNAFYQAADYEELKAHLERRRANDKPIDTDKGSWMNMQLLDAECLCLESITKTLRGENLLGKTGDRFVWCFDGIMVQKRKGRNMPELLRLLERGILKDTGYIVRMSSKPMTNVLPIPEKLDTYECSVGLINPRQWDEFAKVYEGMPIIGAHNTPLFHNNEYFTVADVLSHGFEGVDGEGLSKKEIRAIERKAFAAVKQKWKAKGIKRITQKLRPQFNEDLKQMCTEMTADAENARCADGLF